MTTACCEYIGCTYVVAADVAAAALWMVGVPGTGVLGPAVFRALRVLEGLLEVIPGPRGMGVDVVDHVWMFFMYAICGPFIIIIRSIQLKTPPLPSPKYQK
jgi:hypothetical protein